MRISEIYDLRKTQYELDFVDVDIEKDTPLFLDPFFISTRIDPWSQDATRTIKSFFQRIIDLINTNNVTKARSEFIHLNEPNETCLGVSRGRPRGNGVGDDNADTIFNSLLTSKAVESGIVEDLQDSAIFVEGIGRDKISDSTTNIIRKELIDYTINQCELLGIPLTDAVPSGFYWDAINKKWEQEYTKRLIIDNMPHLLVPKIAVTFYKEYVDRKYYQHYVLNYLQEDHMLRGSSLVQRKFRKDGTERVYVTKKDVEEKDTPFSKEALREFTQRHPEIFDGFKQSLRNMAKPTSNYQITDVRIDEVVEYLKDKLTRITTGTTDAHTYHKTMIGILELIFYPYLTNPIKENPINDGRKRIDITFDNSAKQGYFYRLHNVHQIISRYIYVECKNYSEDPQNPELDQLSGRFSINNSKFGILVCRDILDRDLLDKRCIDLWKQKNELILVLSDLEINTLLDNLLNPEVKDYDLLSNMQRRIIVS